MKNDKFESSLEVSGTVGERSTYKELTIEEKIKLFEPEEFICQYCGKTCIGEMVHFNHEFNCAVTQTQQSTSVATPRESQSLKTMLKNVIDKNDSDDII